MRGRCNISFLDIIMYKVFKGGYWWLLNGLEAILLREQAWKHSYPLLKQVAGPCSGKPSFKFDNLHYLGKYIHGSFIVA